MGRCEPTKHCSFPDGTCGASGHRYHERAGMQAGVCIVDVAGRSERLTLDLRDASDATRTTCGPTGARDTYVEIASPSPQILFADTTSANTAIALRAGPCPEAAAGSEVRCAMSSCGSESYSRLVESVSAGRHCLVVEQAVPSDRPPSIRIVGGGRTATVLSALAASLPPAAETTTCMQGPGTSCMGGSAAAFVLPLCPDVLGMLSITIDPVDDPPSLDAMVSVRRELATGPEISPCTNNAAGQEPEVLSAFPVGGPDLVWILVSGTLAGGCGPFALDYSVASP